MSITAYHPCPNRVVERFHRQLKTELITSNDARMCLDNLPLVLLSIRNVIKEDLGCMTSGLVFRTTFMLLGQFVNNHTYTKPTTQFIQNFKQQMDNLLFTPIRTNSQDDSLTKPLTPTYTGPYKVIAKKPKYFTLLIHRKSNCFGEQIKSSSYGFSFYKKQSGNSTMNTNFTYTFR